LVEISAHFQDEFTIMKPLGTTTIGSMWTPPEVAPMPTEGLEDYDPVPDVKIGVGKVLTEEQESSLKALIRKFKHVVNKIPGVCRVAGARIDTGTNRPINIPLRRTSPAQRADLEKELKELHWRTVLKPLEELRETFKESKGHQTEAIWKVKTDEPGIIVRSRSKNAAP
jgi:hypothetical protein